ncbi:MAG TPA: site-2 protease family protein [Verrucomicrobiae bacterium]|jgi:Zn-dependent protease
MANLNCFFIVTILWVFSVCLHEFGHAWAAYRGGDYTVRDKGYLTMNPFKYLHPVYSLLMPVVFLMLGGIGLPGGAVYIERQLLRSRAWDCWVSLAGPTMNVALILLLGLGFKSGLIPYESGHIASYSMAFLLQLQISALLLNLLPLPPLDGFQALSPWLPDEVRERMLAASNYTMLILFVALWNIAPLNHAFWGAVNWICSAMGVSPGLAAQGYFALRFWEQRGF